MKEHISTLSWLAVLSMLPTAVLASTAEDVYTKVAPSVVTVVVRNPDGIGSGVVVNKGKVATNLHVAGNSEVVAVHHQGKMYRSRVMMSLPESDLALLDVPELDAPAVNLSTTSRVRVGQTVFALGSPAGLELTLTTGIVSALRSDSGNQIIQTSAQISPGSSGGGLFDEKGNLIGITTFKGGGEAQEGLGFAMSADLIHDLLNPSKKRKDSTASIYAYGGLFVLILFLGVFSRKYVQQLLERLIDVQPKVVSASDEPPQDRPSKHQQIAKEYRADETIFFAMANREWETGQTNSEIMAKATTFAHGVQENVHDLYLRFRANDLLDAEQMMRRKVEAAPKPESPAESENTPSDDDSVLRIERIEKNLLLSAKILGLAVTGAVALTYIKAME